MTEHLPECPMNTKGSISRCLLCICDALSACEQRVRLGVADAREVALKEGHEIDDWPGGFYCLTCTPLAEYGVPVSLWPTREAVTHGGEVAPQAGKIATDRQDAVSVNSVLRFCGCWRCPPPPARSQPLPAENGKWVTYADHLAALRDCEQRVLDAAVQRVAAVISDIREISNA